MAAESSQTAASSSTSRWTYDVFLNFRGEDTRRGFTDHLHSALKRKGFIVFRDDEKLERGGNIQLELLKAIQKSEFAVIIISENYAFSTWCLTELTEIVKCKRRGRLTILPVFYDVNPSDVRKLSGNFARAFAKHTEDNINEERRKRWRDALEEVCNLSGWDVRGRHESIVVEEICIKISNELSRKMLNITDDLIGIESQLEKFMTLLCIRGDDTQFIGICGMGGIGKTTLVEVIYSKVFSRFDAYCFISNIREESRKSGSLVCLQQQLISQILGEEEPKICNTFQGRNMIASRIKNKKVFIVLDDVDKEDQLEELLGKHNWFGEGSKILLTSRDEHLLKRHVDEIYDVEKLNDHDALQLFNLKAFKQYCYEGNYAKLAEDIVKYAEGLPLALKVFGSFLFGSKIDAWKSALDRLKANFNVAVFDKLYISFQGLEELTKKLFLDIACFFKGKHITSITDRLKSLGHFPEINIKVLEGKSLIKITRGILEMHELLQEMGYKIVRQEASGRLGQYSRLWSHEDVVYVLSHDIGTDAIESIVLNLSLVKQVQLTFAALSKMSKLRMIEIKYEDIDKPNIDGYMAEDFETINSYFKGLQQQWQGDSSKLMLSDELRVMEWWSYPLESLPVTFQLDNLVEFITPGSCIKLLWNARKSFDILKHIDLRYSQNLIETPDFSRVPNLEKLNLEGCIGLSMVHPFIVFLKKLRFLSIGGLPSNPIDLRLPNSISSLSSLEKLNLSYCNLSDETLPTDLDCLSSLKSLNLSGNKFTKIPGNISKLSKLLELFLSDCIEFQVMPKLPIKLEVLCVEDCPSLERFDRSISREMLLTDVFSLVTAYFGDDGKAFKELRLTRADCDVGYENIKTVVAWGLTFGSDIPEWFIQRNRSFHKTVQSHFGLMLTPSIEFKLWGCALFIVYEVYELDYCQRKVKRQKVDEHGSSSSGVFDENNPTLPEFVCRWHFNRCPSESFLNRAPVGHPTVGHVFRIPEVSTVGLNGVWMFVSFECFQSLRCGPFGWYSLGTSITASNLNVEVKECGARLLFKDDVSDFLDVLSCISPQGLDLESLRNLFIVPLGLWA